MDVGRVEIIEAPVVKGQPGLTSVTCAGSLLISQTLLIDGSLE